MKRHLLSIIIGIALVTPIIAPFPARLGVPAAQAAYNESESGDIQASVSPGQVNPDPNQSITVTYNIDTRGYDGDWYVQVNRDGDPDLAPPINSLLKKDLMAEKQDDKISGSWTIKEWWLSPTAQSNPNSPVTPGTYDFRFVGPRAWATSPLTHHVEQNHYWGTYGSFAVIAPAGIQLTCPTTAQPMDNVTVSWQGTLSDPNAWIGLFTKDAPDTSPLPAFELYNLSGKSSWTRQMQVTPGTYNFRIFQYNTRCGISPDIVVAYNNSPGPTPVVSEDPAQAHPGDTISISWSQADVPDTGDTYSLILCQPYGTGPKDFYDRATIKSTVVGTSGVCQYELPDNLGAGDYCIKMKDFMYNQIWATSNVFTVAASAAAPPSTLQLTAAASDQGVVLNWTAPGYNKTVVGYYPYRGTSAGGEASDPLSDFPLTGNSYTDDNVKTGTTYYYILRPVFSDSSQGPVSNEASATAGAPTTPTTDTSTNSSPGTIVLQVGNPTMTVNGTSQAIDAGGTVPVIKYSRVFLPIRAILEAMGASVAWDAANRQVTITSGTTTILLWIGRETAQVNGQSKTLDVAPYISDTNRTMLPLRFVTENLNCQVEWDGTNRSVTITYAPSSGASGGTSLPPGTGISPTKPLQLSVLPRTHLLN